MTRIAILLVFIATLLLGFFLCSTSANRICFLHGIHEFYNDEEKICCNKALHNRLQDQECCNNSVIYSKSKELCCEGQIVNLFAPPEGVEMDSERSCNDGECSKQICCGEIAVDEKDVLCCQNKPIKLNHTQLLWKDFLYCCGNGIIDKRTHFCCNGSSYSVTSPLDCCGEKIYDKNAEKCLQGFNTPIVLDKYKDICKNTEYDTRKNGCCDGVLNDMPETNPTDFKWNQNKLCCDSLVYDQTKNKCCRERPEYKTHLIANEPEIHCCGDAFYNETHQVCYKGKILEKRFGQQCGYVFVDGEREKCCADVLTYNPSFHDCCNGDTFNIIPKNQTCCNGEGLTDNKLCCQDTISCYKKSETHNECCYNENTKSGTSYNSNNNEYCAEGKVVYLSPGASHCSGSYSYYPKTQICCGNMVWNISLGYDKCCDDMPYNSMSQQCCSGNIDNIPATQGSCCLDDLKVYHFDDMRNPCIVSCGSTTYDNMKEVCCEGKVHQKHDTTECCGSSAINSLTTNCCGEQFPFPKTGNRECCGDRDIFNKKHSKCRNGQIVPRDPVLRKLTSVQHLCNPTALKHFDGSINYACTSIYALKGRITVNQISENLDSNITTINITLTDVKNLNRGKHFTTLSGSKNINFVIDVLKSEGVKCKERYLDRYCEVFVFFNTKVKSGHVRINSRSKFFMAGYTRKREILVTKHLSYQFCRDNFDFQNIP